MLMPLTGAWPLSSGFDGKVDMSFPAPMAPVRTQTMLNKNIASTSEQRPLFISRSTFATQRSGTSAWAAAHDPYTIGYRSTREAMSHFEGLSRLTGGDERSENL